MQYPVLAKQQGIEGKVLVSFIVNAEGDIYDILIEEGVHPLLDAEVMRIINKLPKWNPATIDNKPVSAVVFFPVNFLLK